MKARVVLVDSYVLVREMLAWILRENVGFEVAGEAGSGLEAIDLCRRVQPQLVISELLLPELSGAEVTRRIRQTMPGIQVLIFSGTVERRYLMHGMAARPHGMIQKLDSLQTLRDAIRVVSSGGSYFTPFICGMLGKEPYYEPEECLTRREREILQMVAESCTSKEIASRLALSTKTVENHRQRLMDKLQLRDVAALTRYAVRHGFVDSSK